MRRSVLALAGSACLLLFAAAASAASYRVLEGTLTDAATGQALPLTGSFETSVAFGGTTRPMVLVVDDFALQAGEQSFTHVPTPYLGLAAVSLADQLHVDGDAVVFLLLQAGGVVEEADGDVTIRTVEFRADRSDGGRALGELPEGPEPRRLDLQGRLFQVDRTFRISPSCTLPLLVPLPDGGGGTALPPRVPDGGSVLSPPVLTGGPSDTDTTPLATAAGTLAASQASPDVPTLDELGITAPDGAEVSFDASGALVVSSEGDLLVAGGPLDLPGLSSVTLTTSGNVTAEGEWSLPADVSLTIEAGGSVTIAADGTVDAGGSVTITAGGAVIGEDLVSLPPDASLTISAGGGAVDGGSLIGLPGGLYLPSPPVPIQSPVPLPCLLLPVVSQEVPVGSFSLVASAAQPADVELWPGRRHSRVRPGSRGVVAMLLHGSSQLDVRDVVPDSLRLGRGEAAPVGRVAVVGARGHRDRRRDLLALFRVRAAAIAFGDTFVCLSGATADGRVFEGCDAIDTAPWWHHPSH